jgi:hypothetical protein
MSGGGTIVWTDVCWLAAAALAMAGVGAVLLWLGRRGRLVGDHPHCRACGYDLSGLGKETTSCPECGGDLAPDKATVIGRRTPRVACLWAGGLLLLFALATAVQDARMSVRAWELEANRPVWWLRRQLKAAKPDRDRAFAELRRRLDAHELWASQTTAVARDLIALQSDPAHNSSSGWVEFIATARRRGALGDAEWRWYASQAVTYEARCRARVAQGDCLPFESEFGLRAPRGTRLWFTHRLSKIEVSGVRLELPANDPLRNDLDGTVTRSSGRYGHPPYELRPELLARAGIKAGPQTLKLLFEVSVHDDPISDESAASSPPLVQKTVTCELPWTLLPPHASSVEVVQNPEVDTAVHASVGLIDDVWCKRIDGGESFLSVRLKTQIPGLHLASRLYARVGSREWPLGRILYRTDVSVRLPDFDAARFDLILRPDVDSAVHTVDVTRIWGGELVLRDVPVVWLTREGYRTVPPPERTR